jgi:integrase
MADTTLVVQPANGNEVAQPFDELVALTLQTVAPSSARIYRQTYDLWRAWCAENGAQPLDLRPTLVLGFIGAQNATKATRQRQLSALRKLAQMRHIRAPSDATRQIVEALKVVKASAASLTGEPGHERAKRALTPSQADRVLRVWDDQAQFGTWLNTAWRNSALIAVLGLGALRRSEAATLKWQDIDFENGVITVRHGKGDKSREVPLAGDLALEALRLWQMCMESGRAFVFCPILKGDKIGTDKPLSGTDVYRIVRATAALSGVEFNPHDLRRTFITEALATGTPLATVQAAAGHARGETTLRYVQAVDARRARKDLKLRYG